MTTTDANGIVFLEDTDNISPFHTLINGLQTATSAAISPLVGGWTSFTPTWTGLTVGNATQSSSFKEIGKTVLVRVDIALGSTSVVTGDISLTLPVGTTPWGASAPLGTAQLIDSGTSWTGVVVRGAGTNLARILATNTTTLGRLQTLSATSPFTWGAGDVIRAQFIYEES